MIQYLIHREGEERALGAVIVMVQQAAKYRQPGVIKDGEDVIAQYELFPQQSLKIRNHSPDGFEFGYGGSGPSQLALAILLNYTGKPPEPACYQAFKFMFIMPMKHPGGTITGDDIEKFLETWKAEQEGVYQGQ